MQWHFKVYILHIFFIEFGNNSYIINFGFEISNVSFAINTELRNDTYDLIQNTINGLVSIARLAV